MSQHLAEVMSWQPQAASLFCPPSWMQHGRALPTQKVQWRLWNTFDQHTHTFQQHLQQNCWGSRADVTHLWWKWDSPLASHCKGHKGGSPHFALLNPLPHSSSWKCMDGLLHLSPELGKCEPKEISEQDERESMVTRLERTHFPSQMHLPQFIHLPATSHFEVRCLSFLFLSPYHSQIVWLFHSPSSSIT